LCSAGIEAKASRASRWGASQIVLFVGPMLVLFSYAIGQRGQTYDPRKSGVSLTVVPPALPDARRAPPLELDLES
jgi:hypothetical protein